MVDSREGRKVGTEYIEYMMWNPQRMKVQKKKARGRRLWKLTALSAWNKQWAKSLSKQGQRRGPIFKVSLGCPQAHHGIHTSASMHRRAHTRIFKKNSDSHCRTIFQMLSFGGMQTTISVGNEGKWPLPNVGLDRMTVSLNYLSVQSLSRVQNSDGIITFWHPLKIWKEICGIDFNIFCLIQ